MKIEYLKYIKSLEEDDKMIRTIITKWFFETK
jgi:hypothetical protein